MLQTYWNIGRRIVEEEQNGKNKANYGDYIIKNLSKELTKYYGREFSTTNLKMMRHLYNECQIVNKEILTSIIDSKTKMVGKATLIRMNLFSFDKQYKSIIYALGLIEKKYKIIDCDIDKLNRFVHVYLQDCNDLFFEDIFKEKNISILQFVL